MGGFRDEDLVEPVGAMERFSVFVFKFSKATAKYIAYVFKLWPGVVFFEPEVFCVVPNYFFRGLPMHHICGICYGVQNYLYGANMS